MFISDLTKTGEYAYRAEITEGNIKAQSYIKQTVIRRGAYEMSSYAVNTTRRPLGTLQQQRAGILKVDACEVLSRALMLAGWRDEWIEWGGMRLMLWWPPQE